MIQAPLNKSQSQQSKSQEIQYDERKQPGMTTTPATISIKQITEAEEKKNGEESMVLAGMADIVAEPFSQEKLEEMWNEYMEIISARHPSFSSALSKYLPQLKDNYLIEITTDNAIAAKSSENLKNLIGYLKEKLNNHRIHYKMIITKNIESKTPYTDKEKYDVMVKKNPALKDLKEKFDLEIDF